MKRFFLALALSISAAPALAQGTGLGWNPNAGGNASTDLPFVVTNAQSTLSAERVLAGDGSTIQVTDGGANGNITLSIVGPLIQSAGGTGFSSYAAGDILVANDSGSLVKLPLGSNGYILSVDTSLNPKLKWIAPTASGTVTSFSAGDLSPLFTTSEATVTTTPALSFSLSNAAANTVFGNFTGSSAAPTFGTVTIAAGGTGQTTQTAAFDALAPTTTQGDLIAHNGSNNVRVAKGTANQVLGMNSAATAHEYKTITAGSNITVTHGTNSITIAGNAGTVTSFSAGDLSPLFTTSEATATTTPALTFSLTNANANTVFAGPTSGGAGAPSYRALVAADIPSGFKAFGGDGSDGAITISAGGTEATTKVYNATTFTVNNSLTKAWQPGTIINATSTVTFGTGDNLAVGVQQTTLAYQDGAGPCPGMAAGSSGGGGGGGGGNGGQGGAGAPRASTGGQGGMSQYIYSGMIGSGGGSGYTGSMGGAGGGQLKIIAVGAVTIGSTTTLNADGAAGTTTGVNGAGGGSGGVILIASQTSITNNGTIRANGGNGSNGATYGGGGGGGGWIILYSPSNTAGTLTVNGGSAGTGGTAVAGSTGQTLTITGTPTLPLLVEIERDYKRLARIPANHCDGRSVAALYADGDFRKFALFCGSLTETCIELGDAEALRHDVT